MIKKIPLRLCQGVYPPSEDTYFFLDVLSRKKFSQPFFKKIVDMGTGTGILAITATKMFPEAMIIAVDININAVNCADQNLMRNNVKKYRVIHSDLFEKLKDNIKGHIDLILFNPPYLIGDKASTSVEHRAWNGGREGVKTINRFLAVVSSMLTPSGKIMLLVEHRNLKAMNLVNKQKITGVFSTKIPGEKLYVLEISI